ncbi:MAG TPA: FTR1 family protein [Gemmatimonadota bacterium]|jgi:high-affinity iron transporter
MPFSVSDFLQSLTIVGREGLEVVLLLGAMLAVVRHTGEGQRAGALWWGAGLAAIASVITAVALEGLFRAAERVELLEGVTLVAAAVVLFWVSHWLLARADAARWSAYVKDHIRRASRGGSSFALGAVAFLAVYREGAETVLFYRALFARGAVDAAAVALGFGAGLVALGVVVAGLARIGGRIPLRPFFTVTSALLLLLAFTFAGAGVHELQEAGVVPETAVAGPRVPALGIHPTVESLVAQALLLLAIPVPLLPRLLRRTPEPFPSTPSRSGDSVADATA